MSDPDFQFEMMGMHFNDPEILRQTLKHMEVMLEKSRALSEAVGSLCVSFSSLDWNITRLYEPLLQCSEAQAACIADENISRRCAVAVKLVHLEKLPHDLIDWISALLLRADGELGALRNRYIHDAYAIKPEGTLRIERRPKLGKPQSHQRRKVTYNTEHPTTVEEIEHVSERVTTVTTALMAAASYLRLWRQSGQPPQLDPQWLPASKPNARMRNYQADAEALEILLAPLEYDFD
jgi:hypothetical protein